MGLGDAAAAAAEAEEEHLGRYEDNGGGSATIDGSEESRLPLLQQPRVTELAVAAAEASQPGSAPPTMQVDPCFFALELPLKQTLLSRDLSSLAWPAAGRRQRVRLWRSSCAAERICGVAIKRQRWCCVTRGHRAQGEGALCHAYLRHVSVHCRRVM